MGRRLALARNAALLAGLAVMAACSPAPAPLPAPAPVPVAPPPAEPAKPAAPSQEALRLARAEAARQANRKAAAAEESAASRNMRLFLATAEAGLISRGLLREDRHPRDVPYTAADLANSFVQVALRDEYLADGSRAAAGGAPAVLRRWQQPVRIQLEFGDSASTATQARLRSEIAGYARRLAGASDHPVGLAGSGGNVIVLILNEDERRAIGPRLAALVPGIPAGDVEAIRNLAVPNHCIAFAYSQGGGAEYVSAVALIRAELPPRLRSSCIEEELAQAMGLANDSRDARPSIFNDDERFARLTGHDEKLLRILYDRRLSPGMTEAQAGGIVDIIAAELGGS